MLSCPWRIVLLAAVAVSLGSAASAQVTFNAPGFMPTKKPPPPPAPRPPSGRDSTPAPYSAARRTTSTAMPPT